MENMYDIDKATTFEEIVEIKKRAYQVNKNSGIHIERILSGLYKNPTHFIFELLQNAEDADASEVQITLDGEKLIFRHDGRPFDLRDIKGITGVDYSSKADDITQIGRFGIGFKAVFGICNAPEIYSDNYNFRIRNFYVPEKIGEPLKDQKDGFTYIVLPFKEEVKGTIYGRIEDALVNMDPDTVLFLRKIRQLDYLTNRKCGYYERKKDEKFINGNKYYHCQIIGGQGVKSSYLFFQENVGDNDKLQVSIAYGYDAESKKLTAEEDSTKLVVFFPTERDTFLKFKINGPYQTTPTRENIPETEKNKEILVQTVNLYKKSLICLRDLGLMSADFIDSLPIEARAYGYSREDIFYDSFFSATKDSFLRENILPTNDGRYTNANGCVLARGPVTDLLSSEDIEKLFGRKNWLSTDITRDRTNSLYRFLISTLKVREIDYEVILSNISKEFLKTKDKKWFVSFYSKGNNNISTVNQYLTREFIITESGDIVSPFIKDKAYVKLKNVYLPSKLISDNSKIVSKEILENKDVKTFFTTIGITEVDIVESIRTQWLPSISDSENEPSYLESLQILFLEFAGWPTAIQKELIDLLSSYKCLAYLDEDKELVFTEPKNLFMAHGDARILYDNCEKTTFLTKLVDEYAQQDREFYEFLKKIGVNTSIKLVETSSGLTYEERRNLLKNANYSYIKESSVDIWGLDDILRDITKQKSKVLWNALNNIKESLFTSKLEWTYYGRNNSVNYGANFVRKLQESAWLFNESGECVCPNEMYEEDVRGIYGGGICLRYFKFKPNAVKLLPENDQRKLELTKGVPVEVLEQLLEQYERITEPEVVNVIPEETAVEIEEVELENPREEMTAEELTQSNDEDRENGEEQVVVDLMEELYADVNIPDKIIEQIVVKKVSNEAELDGDLGERFVVSALKKKYLKKEYSIYNDDKDGFTAIKDERVVEVVRHNKGGKVQKGYDISVSCKGDVIAYIEVKSKKGSDKEFFKVSGLQWEFAKKLNEEDNGDKHYVFVVTNVREPEKTKITSVKNPYKLWIDGKLEVDPVRIKY